ncbi:Hypothetical_protein [Hexamita inflata]|uniref:Hypothetical_protein n=1 Tax=Hexamita inflata TaxID=28002 RepID=A0ABP1GWQ9_9EUKA
MHESHIRMFKIMSKCVSIFQKKTLTILIRSYTLQLTPNTLVMIMIKFELNCQRKKLEKLTRIITTQQQLGCQIISTQFNELQPVFRKAKPKKKKPGEAQRAEKEDISAVSSKETCQDNLNTDEISDEVRNIEDIINIHIDPEQLDPLRGDNSSECSDD